MAPEVLGNHGYSFSADVWGLGVIMFTMLIGSCPFEGRSVEDTYNRIKTLNYTIPKNIDPNFKKLIKKIFKLKPSLRPHLNEIRNDNFFNSDLD